MWTNTTLCIRYAEVKSMVERDVNQALKGALTKVNGGHFSAITDPQQVAILLRAIDDYNGGFVIKSALQLAPLVFVRPSELCHAEWQHIDLDTKEWRYLVTKTDTLHIVPLSCQAIAILEAIKPLTVNGRFVFPSTRTPNGSRAVTGEGLLVALRSMGYAKDKMTIHGFRAMARTRLGFRPDFIIFLKFKNVLHSQFLRCYWCYLNTGE
jgi:integrase